MIGKINKSLLKEIVISVICITQNDSNIITEILKKIEDEFSKKYPNFEILVIDNNSQDDTVDKIRNHYKKTPHVRIIQLSKSYSTELALTAGLDNCIGDYAVLFNIYTDPVNIIPKMVDKLLSSYDIVIGKYKKNLMRNGPLSSLLLSIVKLLSSHEFYHDSNYLIALNRKTINSITKVRRKSRNFSYINSLIGFKKTILEYHPLKNYLHKLNHENFFELLFRITDIIISNSFKPMRVLVALGMLLSLSFLFYVFIIAIFAIFFNKHFAPQGWISMSTVLGTMFFLLFSLLTLISEYIIRVLNESRNEPLYFIYEEVDKSVISIKKNKLNITR